MDLRGIDRSMGNPDMLMIHFCYIKSVDDEMSPKQIRDQIWRVLGTGALTSVIVGQLEPKLSTNERAPML